MITPRVVFDSFLRRADNPGFVPAALAWRYTHTADLPGEPDAIAHFTSRAASFAAAPRIAMRDLFGPRGPWGDLGSAVPGFAEETATSYVILGSSGFGTAIRKALARATAAGE